MKLLIGTVATVSGLLFALSMASANPSLLPKHEGYPIRTAEALQRASQPPMTQARPMQVVRKPNSRPPRSTITMPSRTCTIRISAGC